MTKLQFTLHTSEFRGDHNAAVQIAIEPKKGEPLAEMLNRALISPTDYVTARKVVSEKQ